ncbi:hypothetical protein SISSUDRAFT_1126942 [Sistotremastrum suecicum HHB10207 ss-3]|uniref:Integrase core domain-containing protein n=1 Tax=Sistotremastrum suecicum HHB10207 ss-3 TaxID=1314776 RepID=A0A166FQU9_9AGAM|nr:hypothetical protein SISSUDRAFT_1126942 [Sistotremastrum suecicum HHB10207 ss-3]
MYSFVRYSLDALLHTLFLPVINAELRFFAESWNEHKIDSKTGPRRSPWDMWVFDMLARGVRGNPLGQPTEEPLTEEQLEVYGVDWAALQQQDIRDAQAANNPGEGHSSWIGRRGPPDNLAGVELDPPASHVNAADVFHQFSHDSWEGDQTQRWRIGLNLACSLHPSLF